MSVSMHRAMYTVFFFFNDTATTEIYTLSLHDALPISGRSSSATRMSMSSPGSTSGRVSNQRSTAYRTPRRFSSSKNRSEEHTSELQSRQYLVCRLLLEKKKKTII